MYTLYKWEPYNLGKGDRQCEVSPLGRGGVDRDPADWFDSNTWPKTIVKLLNYKKAM